MISLLKNITLFPLRRLIPALLITGFLVSVSALLLLYRLDYRDGLDGEREGQARQTAAALRDFIESAGIIEGPQLTRLVNSLSTGGSTTILITDQTRTVLHSTENGFNGKQAQFVLRLLRIPAGPELESFFTARNAETVRVRNEGNIVYILPLHGFNSARQPGFSGYVIVVVDSSEAMRQFDRRLYLLILPSLAVIALPLIFFMYIYEKIYKTRLNVLMETTEALKRGELDARVNIFGKDEIADLGRLFNEMAAKIGTLAYRDSLTGIRNRASFEEAVSFQLNSARPAAMVFMDLDGFKYVNETFGHNVGDRMLQLVTERIASLIPPEGTFARIGGDEFALFVPDFQDITPLQILCDRIIHYVSQDFSIEGIHHHIGISMGIALYPIDGSSFHEILMNADLAMYQAKHSGKNMFTMFNDAIRDQMKRKTVLMNQLHRAFRRNIISEQFYPVYQPIIDVETGTLSHVESLVRWRGNDGIRATTAEIIPLLEESGLVRELGFFVFDKVTEDFHRILDVLPANGPLPGVTVNVSVIQLLDPAFLHRLGDIVIKNGIKPERIIIEITESELMKQPEKVIRSLNSLHERGFRFAIDDFGTGYSSLSYLKNLPVDFLKIDRSFVKDVSFDEKSQVIARSIIVLGKALGLKLIAEGVEDLETARMIARLGTDYLQGYFCSRPLPLAEVQNLIKSRFKFYDPQPEVFSPISEAALDEELE